MPMSQPVKVGSRWGSYSFPDGFRPISDLPTHYRQEASRNPLAAEAVFNRLVRQERWDEAEELLETFDF